MHNKTFRYAYEIDLEEDTTPAKVVRLVGNNKKVLELGCGPGHMSQVLRNNFGCNIIGIEIDEEAAKVARNFCHEVVVCNLDDTDLTRLFEKNTFDVIVMADVLEHLKEPQHTLVQCKQLVSDDGYMVISIPNVAYAGVVASLMMAQFPYADLGILDRTHLRFFTGPSFRILLQRLGYRIEKWLTHQVSVEYTEFKDTFERLPSVVKEYLLKSPDSLVYQFIAKVKPSVTHEEDPLLQELDYLTETCIKERDLWMNNNYCIDTLKKNYADMAEVSLIQRFLKIFKRSS